MASSSKRKGLNEDEKSFIDDNYGRITHYFEKSKCLDINVDAEYEPECKFAIHFFEDEQIRTLSSKLRKITLWIECGSFLAVNLWNKMENIINLLNAAKDMIHHLNIFLTHECGTDDDENNDDFRDIDDENNDSKVRKYLFEQFMKLIVCASNYRLNYINFNIEGIEHDLYEIYIAYLIKLLLPNISNKTRSRSTKTKKRNNNITGLSLAIFGNNMFDNFCDEKTKKLPYAIIATTTLKSLSVTFDNITIDDKINSFLHSISLNNHISCINFTINDRGSFKMRRQKSMIQFNGNNNNGNNDNMTIITSFYVTLYAIFTNKWKHLKAFGLEYNVSRREYNFNNNNNIPLCKLDEPELMRKYVLQPIIDKCYNLTQFEWRVDMRWNEINLYPLSLLFDSVTNKQNKHDFEFINISKICTSNIEAMNGYLSTLKHSNRCKELKLSGLNGRLFTELLCNFISIECGSCFETIRLRMKYEMNDIGLLEKHTMSILNCFVLHLEYLYKMYQNIIPSILNEYGIKYNQWSESHHGLPPYLIAIIVDFCKMRYFKLDFSLLMNRKQRQPLTQNNLEQTLSVKINALIDKLKLNKNGNGEIDRDFEYITIKRDRKNNHYLLKQLFKAFCYTKNVNFYFTAVDCKLLFSINP